jgi:hypothetical protein
MVLPAAEVTLALGEGVDAPSILAVVMVDGAIGFILETRAGTQFGESSPCSSWRWRR